ncbi:MAG: hypothetical protein O4965_18880 [Trichodesmium sp. St19_bin1]|nr:hypothetical protein [Trichodesmium sp. St19_bin1]
MPGAILVRNATANAIMPRFLSIQEHLSVDELEKNYRITYDPIERT